MERKRDRGREKERKTKETKKDRMMNGGRERDGHHSCLYLYAAWGSERRPFKCSYIACYRHVMYRVVSLVGKQCTVGRLL